MNEKRRQIDRAMTAISLAGAICLTGGAWARPASAGLILDKNLTEAQRGASRVSASEIVQLIDRLLRATTNKDKETLEKLLDDDFLHTSQRGEVLSKGQFVKLITSGDGEEVTTEAVNVSVRLYGAVAIVRSEVRIPDAMIHTSSTRFRQTDVLVKRKGRWRFVSTQQSPIFEERR